MIHLKIKKMLIVGLSLMIMSTLFTLATFFLSNRDTARVVNLVGTIGFILAGFLWLCARHLLKKHHRNED